MLSQSSAPRYARLNMIDAESTHEMPDVPASTPAAAVSFLPQVQDSEVRYEATEHVRRLCKVSARSLGVQQILQFLQPPIRSRSVSVEIGTGLSARLKTQRSIRLSGFACRKPKVRTRSLDLSRLVADQGIQTLAVESATAPKLICPVAQRRRKARSEQGVRKCLLRRRD